MLQPGQIFAGRYCIRHLIGSGAMADVYEVRHVLTEHALTLKVLRSPNPGAGARNFALEARIDARLNSPHIVHVQDAGIDETSGFPYLVLEPLQGKTLAKLLQEQPEGRLSAEQTLEVLRQVALGLDAAHAYGVVHRNLEPENIFLTDQSLVKILDFGLAKVLDSSGQVTQQLRGTPYYMAAEQANCQAVSPETDVCALGLVAYRALTGRIYWRCANRRGHGQASLGEVVVEISTPRRDPPSARLREVGSQLRLPEGFDEWLLRCIDVQPRRRFPSAGEAVAALGRALGASAGAAASGSAELTRISPTRPAAVPGRPRAAAPEERRGIPSVGPATLRPTRALRKWGSLGVAAGAAVLIASVYYPLRQRAAPAPMASGVTQTAAQGLAPAPAEPAAPPAATAPAPTPVAVEAAPLPTAAPTEQGGAPRIAPISAAAQADAPPAPSARKRARAAQRSRAAAARRARLATAQSARSPAQSAPAAAPARERGPAAAESQTREAGLASKLGLGAPAEAPQRPPPTALSD